MASRAPPARRLRPWWRGARATMSASWKNALGVRSETSRSSSLTPPALPGKRAGEYKRAGKAPTARAGASPRHRLGRLTDRALTFLRAIAAGLRAHAAMVHVMARAFGRARFACGHAQAARL